MGRKGRHRRRGDREEGESMKWKQQDPGKAMEGLLELAAAPSMLTWPQSLASEGGSADPHSHQTFRAAAA